MQDYDGNEKGYDWLVDGDVWARYIGADNGAPDRWLVTDAGRLYAAILMVTEIPGGEGESVLVNGELLDLSDAYPAVLGILDAAKDAGGEEIYLPLEG